jgi:uncharacterized membrane protein
MSPLPFFLADADTDDILASWWRAMDPATHGGVLIFGAIGLVTLLAVVWAVFLRKRRHRRHSHHHSHEHSSTPAEALKEDGSASAPPTRRAWRRSRRRRRSRNPTLAETGGLPPVRPEGPSDPQP